MTSIGESLRRERLRRNLQLDQVSKELKISSRMLAAIEAEDFQKLPGGVFTKSFVRQYAHLLGLDEEELASEVDRMLHPEQPPEGHKPAGEVIPLPRMEAWQSVGDEGKWNSGRGTWLPALMLVVVVMLVCSAIYAFLQRPKPALVASAHPAAKQAAPPPSPEAAKPAAQANSPAEQPAQADSAAREEGAAASANAPPANAPPANAPSATPSPATPSPAAPTPTPQTPAPPTPNSAAPAAPGPVHVTITALEPVWVRAMIDGKYAFSATIDANQTRTLDANQTVTLRLGNAGGATIELNGKPIGAVGPKGQVRNVQLTSGGFQILEAPRPPAPVLPL